MTKVTCKNRMDLKLAKKFFEGKTFAEIKEQIKCGCFKNAVIKEEMKDLLQIRFESLIMQMKPAKEAKILPYVLVYDENDIISGSWNIEEEEGTVISLDSVRKWLEADEEENVHNILVHIKNNFPKKWNEFIADELNDKVNRLTLSELPDSLYCEVVDDWKGENEEKVIEEWLIEKSYGDIARKICFVINGKALIKEMLNEL